MIWLTKVCLNGRWTSVVYFLLPSTIFDIVTYMISYVLIRNYKTLQQVTTKYISFSLKDLIVTFSRRYNTVRYVRSVPFDILQIFLEIYFCIS